MQKESRNRNVFISNLATHPNEGVKKLMRHTMHGVNRWKGWVDPTRPRFTGAFPKVANYNEIFYQISKKARLDLL